MFIWENKAPIGANLLFKKNFFETFLEKIYGHLARMKQQKIVSL